MIQNPIFILGCHKSGTSLLRSLLDGHPDLFVIPNETHPFPLLRHWVEYPYQRRRPGAIDREQFIEAAVGLVERQNEHHDPHADVILEGRYDPDVVRRSLEGSSGGSDAEWIDAYFRALHMGLHGAELGRDLRVVEKSVENAEFALALARLFPDARFVHIVRNPYATLVAIRKHKTDEKGYPLLADPVRAIRNGYRHLFKNERILDRYWVVRYEDLVSEPGEVMRALADFVGIPFGPGLLQPTTSGRPWSGNSTSGRAFSGISSSPVDSWSPDLEHLECHFVNAFAGPICARFGYGSVEPDRPAWRRVKRESRRTWWRNRASLTVLRRAWRTWALS